jgi:cleavage and polyadenylation specificity factor subunit 1
MQSVTLESGSLPGGYRDFIAVGTGFDFAEDRATRGNVSEVMVQIALLVHADKGQTYIFEVVETVGSPEQKISGWKLKLRTKDPARNPVSAVSNINGYLLNSNGPKVGPITVSVSASVLASVSGV